MIFLLFLSALIFPNITQAHLGKPRVSIITPVYKGEEFIKGFLEDTYSTNYF